MRRKLVSLTFLVVLPLLAQSPPKPELPDPVKFVAKLDIVWKVVRSVLDDMGFSIQLEDRTGGKIVTKPYEFITGALTSTELDKVAIKSNSISGNWMKARYSVEALLEIVTPSETMVTIRTRMEALNRDLDGTEKWIPVESLGTFEKRVLGKISLKLIGDEPQFDSKKGFWEKSPQPVDPRRPKTVPARPPL